MKDQLIKHIQPLRFPWQNGDPFLFCAYHNDRYPRGNAELGPDASLVGRQLGSDFAGKDGWSMYHGTTVPGFPAHPHCGFETVTIATRGLIDHSDSLGAAGRFGNGDVQWMTAGKGVQHCEMFPLLDSANENPLELFQIWLNLPSSAKKVEPYFGMMWKEDIPVIESVNEQGKKATINLIAGTLNGVKALPPAPDSWANRPENEVIIATVQMEAGSSWTLEPASAGINRYLLFFEGGSIQVGNEPVRAGYVAELEPEQEATVTCGDRPARILVLQGRPINEPVAQYGPFVMNSQAEIRQVILDFQQNQFGGWPWPRPDHVHGKDRGRFARYVDGTEEVK